MTRHQHCEIIKAKADNIGLVVFVNDNIGGELKWREMVNSFPISHNHEYFLCLPDRKNECLHWLNGGDVEFRRDGEYWQDEREKYHGWTDYCGMMNNDVEFRIKPQKEKLWIAVKTDKHENIGGCRKVRICSHAFVNKQDAVDYLDLDSAQLIEIEIEVKTKAP